ncbi:MULTISPECIES: hypothetical protein [Pseudomonas]|nr:MULTISPECIES: hypothetical protein [Pseudomonas]NRH44610.1 hypothetical protein [Pseudomonas sp. MS15a(2019)]
MLINITDCWPRKIQEKHDKYIKDVIKKSEPHSCVLLDHFIRDYGGEIALAPADRLKAIIIDIESRLVKLSDEERNNFHMACKKTFNYSYFSSKSKPGWNAYALCSGAIYKLCPYCQLTNIDTIISTSSELSLRPPLDHFYSQDYYPYLSLALYNLVPSCHPCNSSLKSTKNFFEIPHLHPYCSTESVSHKLDVDDYLSYLMAEGITATPKVMISAPDSENINYAEARNSINTFLMEERLAKHQEEVSKLTSRLRIYRPERIPELEKVFGLGFFITAERTLLDFCRSDYKNELLGVAKKDMYDLLWKK